MLPDRVSTRRGRSLHASIAGVVLLALVAAMWFAHGRFANPVLLAYWWVGNGTLICCAYAFTKDRRFEHLSVAAGRIVAIVTAHERDHDELRSCIWSILNQRGVVVDEVHVVDDGSLLRPVEPFAHPRVRWHRKQNAGRQAAQVYVLDRLDPGDWDFVLTVDGDCVPDEQAMERQLRAFSRPRIVATTATVTVRNAEQNLLTRVADLSIGTRVMRRAGRADISLAAISTVTAASLVLYRADVLFDQKRRYLAAAAQGADRSLTMYPDFEGDVIRVREAIAWTREPIDVVTAGRQRLHSATDWWRVIVLALIDPHQSRGHLARTALLLQLALRPLTIGYALIALTLSARHGTLRPLSVVLYAALYLLVRYAITGLYLVERRRTSRAENLWTWVLLTPVEAAYNLLFVGPIKCVALLRLRRPRRAGPTVDRTDGGPTSAVEPSTVYYSGFPTGTPRPTPTEQNS